LARGAAKSLEEVAGIRKLTPNITKMNALIGFCGAILDDEGFSTNNSMGLVSS